MAFIAKTDMSKVNLKIITSRSMHAHEQLKVIIYCLVHFEHTKIFEHSLQLPNKQQGVCPYLHTCLNFKHMYVYKQGRSTYDHCNPYKFNLKSDQNLEIEPKPGEVYSIRQFDSADSLILVSTEKFSKSEIKAVMFII